MTIRSAQEVDVIESIREVHRDVAKELSNKRLKEVLKERKETADGGDVVDKLVFGEYEIEGIRRGLVTNPKKGRPRRQSRLSSSQREEAWGEARDEQEYLDENLWENEDYEMPERRNWRKWMERHGNPKKKGMTGAQEKKLRGQVSKWAQENFDKIPTSSAMTKRKATTLLNDLEKSVPGVKTVGNMGWLVAAQYFEDENLRGLVLPAVDRSVPKKRSKTMTKRKSKAKENPLGWFKKKDAPAASPRPSRSSRTSRPRRARGAEMDRRQIIDLLKDDVTDFSGADLAWNDLSGLNLRKVNFSGANLEGVNFEDSNLRGADLTGANVESANFFKAEMDEHTRGPSLDEVIGTPDFYQGTKLVVRGEEGRDDYRRDNPKGKKRLVAGGKVPKTLSKTMAKRKAKLANKNPRSSPPRRPRSRAGSGYVSNTWEDMYDNERLFHKMFFGDTWFVEVEGIYHGDEGAEVIGADEAAGMLDGAIVYDIRYGRVGGKGDSKQHVFIRDDDGSDHEQNILRQMDVIIEDLAVNPGKPPRIKNPCIGLHFHGKDANELMEALEKSAKRQTKKGPRKKNPLSQGRINELGREIGEWFIEERGFVGDDNAKVDLALRTYAAKQWGIVAGARFSSSPEASKIIEAARELLKEKGFDLSGTVKSAFPTRNPSKREHKFSGEGDKRRDKKRKERGYRISKTLREKTVRERGGYEAEEIGPDHYRMKVEENPKARSFLRKNPGCESFLMLTWTTPSGEEFYEFYVDMDDARKEGERGMNDAGWSWATIDLVRPKQTAESEEKIVRVWSPKAAFSSGGISFNPRKKKVAKKKATKKKATKKAAPRKPKTLKGRAKRAEKKIEGAAKRAGKRVKKDAKSAGKDVKKFAKTKTGYGALGAGAGALLLGPIGAIAGAVGGSKLYDNPVRRKNPSKDDHLAIADRKWNMFEDSWDSYTISNSAEDLLGAYTAAVEAEMHYTHAGVENDGGRGYAPAGAEAAGIREKMFERLGG